ncbi:PilZ domain-containing protein [Massilia sp. DD77]|uniref:PilZ domain-containing protein n=1 Tax=Massilia sp. DD77 TaxID=3109349 RepID=UPI002FFFBCC7
MLGDKRTSARKILKTKAVVAMEGDAPVLGRTADVGANGVSVGVPNPLLVGQTGQVSFEILVDGKFATVSARAKVMYCIISNNEFKVGFQFLNLELAAMTALARFMR